MSIPMPSASASAASGSRKEDLQQQQQHYHQQHLQPRDRNDSSGTDSTDSAITLSSLGESLPSPGDVGDDTADETHATGYEDFDSREYAEEEPVDEHEEALRHYSVEIAAHTAHMFETCYGGIIPEAQSNTATDEKQRTASAASNRNSAGKLSSVDKQDGEKRRRSTSQAMERST